MVDYVIWRVELVFFPSESIRSSIDGLAEESRNFRRGASAARKNMWWKVTPSFLDHMELTNRI